MRHVLGIVGLINIVIGAFIIHIGFGCFIVGGIILLYAGMQEDE